MHNRDHSREISSLTHLALKAPVPLNTPGHGKDVPRGQGGTGSHRCESHNSCGLPGTGAGRGDFAVQRRVQPQRADHPANQAVAHGRRYPSARSFWQSVCHAGACAAIPP